MRVNTYEDSLLDRLLTITLYKTKNKKKATKSRFSYGVDNGVYNLRILGVLNGLFGLELIVHDRGTKW